MRVPIAVSLLVCGLASAAPPYPIESETLWVAPLEEAGKASPRTADLNGDGHLDVVVGAGVENLWGEAVAIDGKNGRLLWRARFPDEVLIADPLLDVDGDGVRDVFVGGRTRLREVVALNGKDGGRLWGLAGSNPEAAFPPLNFVNLVLVDDRDGDGLRDLLIVQSGGRDTLRLAARLHWVRSSDGKILATHLVPDGRESYAIPFYDRRDGGDRLFLGTGGETLSGNLLSVDPLTAAELWRLRAVGGGFIGSPVLVDFNGDGPRDLLISAMNGLVTRVDAATGDARWRWRVRPLWTYVSPVAGEFDGRPGLDVVVAFNRGAWPETRGAVVLWIDGATGTTIAERDFDPRFGFVAASPLVLDVNHDGRDEAMLVFTESVLDVQREEHAHALATFDGGDDRKELFRLELDGYSIATPQLDDLDGNGRLDLLHAYRDGVIRLELRTAHERPPAVRVDRFR